MSVSGEDLLGRWQSLHFEDRQTDEGPHKAEILRNLMTQVQCARQSKILCPDAAYSLMYQIADSTTSVVDTNSEQKGLDNYAEAALSLVEGKLNESSQWTSTLSVDGIKDTAWGKAFFRDTQMALRSVLPTGGGDMEIIMDQSSTRHTCSSDVSSTTAPQPLFRQSGNLNKPSVPQRDIVSGTSGSQCHKQSNQEQSFWNLNKRLEMSNPQKSVVTRQVPQKRNETDAENDAGRLFSRTYDDRRRESAKRPRDVARDDDVTCPASAFKTAKQQLVIDQQKKHSCGQGSTSTVSYGTNKKSLGTRRGINSRFVPPVLGRGEEDSGADDALMRRVTSAVVGSTSAGSNRTTSDRNDEAVDERLKNIEPKMIELISSEIMDHGPPVLWDDIAGLGFAKKTIKEIVVWPMLRPDIFTGLRGPPKGLLLFGPPGTGKTLIGKCIASQSKSTFFSISASSLTSKWVGEGEKMVRALFAVARVNQPAVIFIDEIDSLLSQRSDGENEASRRIKTEFLVQLDGATTGAEDRILVVGATNRPQEIDEAARRRFVKRLYIPLPETAARTQIVVNLVSQQSHSLEASQLESIATQSDGYSGSDMANLCREAALGPIRSMAFTDIENISADQVRPIAYSDFQDALKQVRASVSEKDLDVYLDWNKQYGSWGIG